MLYLQGVESLETHLFVEDYGLLPESCLIHAGTRQGKQLSRPLAKI
jgi:hypothetical protein